jgi:hypothetical protein
VAGIAIDICPSFLVAVHTPFHIVSVNHFYRPLFQTRQPMTNGAIDIALDVNPVGKYHKFWKFIHPLPWNVYPRLNIFDHFKCLRSLADCIGRMTGPTELDVWNSSNTIPLHISVAESTVQIGGFLVMDMIEKNGLIDRYPSVDWKNSIEDTFGLNLISMVGDSRNEENYYDNKKNTKEPLHNTNLYLSLRVCQEKILL